MRCSLCGRTNVPKTLTLPVVYTLQPLNSQLGGVRVITHFPESKVRTIEDIYLAPQTSFDMRGDD